MLGEVREHLQGKTGLERVIFVLHGKVAYQAFQAARQLDGD